ncbi:hypothetical protein F4677DRAFT_161007 [Hypoxylon crocopeplum]|nr:hypothetical protein F4677DRAFT_161007 [Hypoxylon crocopeplum]
MREREFRTDDMENGDAQCKWRYTQAEEPIQPQCVILEWTDHGARGSRGLWLPSTQTWVHRYCFSKLNRWLPIMHEATETVLGLARRMNRYVPKCVFDISGIEIVSQCNPSDRPRLFPSTRAGNEATPSLCVSSLVWPCLLQIFYTVTSILWIWHAICLPL